MGKKHQPFFVPIFRLLLINLGLLDKTWGFLPELGYNGIVCYMQGFKSNACLLTEAYCTCGHFGQFYNPGVFCPAQGLHNLSLASFLTRCYLSSLGLCGAVVFWILWKLMKWHHNTVDSQYEGQPVRHTHLYTYVSQGVRGYTVSCGFSQQIDTPRMKILLTINNTWIVGKTVGWVKCLCVSANVCDQLFFNTI